MNNLFYLNELIIIFSMFSEFVFYFVVLLIVCLIKPFLGRGWLVSGIVFYILAAFFDVQSSYPHSHYITRIFLDIMNVVLGADSSYLYIYVVMPMVDGVALFSFLMFFFLYINKNIFGVEERNFLFTRKGRITRLQYLMVVFIILPVFKPIVLSIEPIIIYYYDYYYLMYDYEIIPSIFATSILFVSACSLSWILVSISVRRWHDCNKTGWFALLPFIPTVVYLGLVRGTQGNNRYGDDPLEMNRDSLE